MRQRNMPDEEAEETQCGNISKRKRGEWLLLGLQLPHDHPLSFWAWGCLSNWTDEKNTFASRPTSWRAASLHQEAMWDGRAHVLCSLPCSEVR